MGNGERYTREDICAVIVTYNPEAVFEEALAALTPQVAHVIAADNGSGGPGAAERLKRAERAGAEIIRLGENKGIACALNRGAAEGRRRGYRLLLTMDQDTILAPDAAEELLKVLNTTEAQSVGINWDGKAEKDEEVSYLITSGNLVTAEAVEQVGGYDEALFIDSVDFDFSLRLADYGYKMIKAAKARAVHRLGETQDGGRYATHSVERYYYIYRNHFYLIRKYRKGHRGFCLKKQAALGLDLGRILLFDRERKDKFRMLAKGYRDSKKITTGNESMMSPGKHGDGAQE